MKKAGIVILTALVSGAVAVGAYRIIDNKGPERGELTEDQKVFFANNPEETRAVAVPTELDFVNAAAEVTPGVVHIRTT